MSSGVKLVRCGRSRSLPEEETFFLEGAGPPVLVLAGGEAGRELASVDASQWAVVLVELSTECLGVYTEESEGSNILGFARFTLGTGAPSTLVEIVRHAGSADRAIATAQETFGAIGWTACVCMDTTGRIVDRLIRPYLNAALLAVDEGLASPNDLDVTVELGLGHPEGPIHLLERTGLPEHALVSRVLFEAYGEQSLVPARRARLALERVRLSD